VECITLLTANWRLLMRGTSTKEKKKTGLGGMWGLGMRVLGECDLGNASVSFCWLWIHGVVK
jgi:hypothetical protein